MPDTKISALPSGTPAQAGDEVPIARAGATIKLTLAQILALVTSITNGGTTLAIDSSGIVTITTVDGINIQVSAGEVRLQNASGSSIVLEAGGAMAMTHVTGSRVEVTGDGVRLDNDEGSLVFKNGGGLEVGGSQGTAGQRLTSGGSGVNPSWAA